MATPNIGEELLSAPFPQMVRDLGLAIAEAQLELDRTSVRIAQLLSGYGEDANGVLTADSSLRIPIGTQSFTLLELGFMPTFYQFVDTIIEVKISISMTISTEEKTRSRTRQGLIRKRKGDSTMQVSSVNAKYSNKYQYTAEGSSLLRTKLVPVPPPTILEERLRKLAEEGAPLGGASVVTASTTLSAADVDGGTIVVKANGLTLALPAALPAGSYTFSVAFVTATSVTLQAGATTKSLSGNTVAFTVDDAGAVTITTP